MANPEHLAILKDGVEVWNRWREENPGIRPDLSEANLDEVNVSEANLQYADIHRTHLYKANVSGAILRGADLSQTSLREADLSEADLGWADLSWTWSDGAILRGADLTVTRLVETEMREADLVGADLSGAYFQKANLRGACMREVGLGVTVILNSDLSLVDLTDAKLPDAVMFNTVLTGSNLSGSVLARTTLANIDLSQVKGLQTVYHVRPSSVGIDSVYRSRGNIPEEFLRGAGVPDFFITYARSLTEQPIAYHSVFISHSSQDEAFASRLHKELQASDIRAWYFPEDAKWGEPLWSEIDQGVSRHDKLVLVCSENSLRSGPVLRELERALNREDREGKSVLFPIRIDDYVFDGWEHERKADVLRKVVGDFSEWETDSGKYEASFARLLEGVQAEE